MINDTNLSNEQLLVQSLNSIRMYIQDNYSSYSLFMEELAYLSDPNDPTLDQTFYDIGLFKNLYYASSLEEVAESVENGTAILAGGVAGGASASVLHVGNVIKNLDPIPHGANPHTALDIAVDIAQATNSNIPEPVRDLAQKVARGATAIAVAAGVVDYAASGFDPDVGAKNATAFGAGALAGLAVGAVVAAGATLLGITAGVPIIAGVAGAIIGGVVAGAVAAGWDDLTSAVASGAMAISDAAEALADAAVGALEQVGQAAVDAVNAGIDAAGEIFSGFLSGVQAVGEWMANGLNDLWEWIQTFGSPLVLDLDGDGIELSSMENANIYWDIDNDGFGEQSGWVTGDDGFLAIDLNGDGIVTDHTELFGSIMQDGFTALSAYDTNGDGVIDANDAQFGDLIVWIDANADGISEASEIYTLSDLDIVSINLNASTPHNYFIEGNHISHVSSYTVDDGVSGPQTFDIVDVWFEYNNTNTSYEGDYTLDLASLFVTTIRGYGNLPDMHVAASMDNDTNNPDSLMSLLQNFNALNFTQLLADDGSVQQMVTDIMYRWAGVDGIDPTSRGSVDARKLEFLENLMGEGYLQQGSNPNPILHAAEGVRMAWGFALNAISGKLIGQIVCEEIFNDGVYYNPATDAFEGFTEFKQDGLDQLVSMSNDASVITNKTIFWTSVINMIDQSVGIANLSSAEKNRLDSMLLESDQSLTVDLIVSRIEHDLEEELSWTPDGLTTYGTNDPDTMIGGSGNDELRAGYGEDYIEGGLGDDKLFGAADNDILNGQLGDDYLHGGYGDDIYLMSGGHGNDRILSGGGADKIVFDDRVLANDLTFSRIGQSQVLIEINSDFGYGTILVDDQTSHLGGAVAIEFADGSIYDQNTIDYTVHGTSANDTLRGIGAGYGGSGNDTLYGYDGDDILEAYYLPRGGHSGTTQNFLYGGNGNDTLRGDHGYDELYGEAGDDRIFASHGDDLIVGGTGDDYIRGEGGADTFMFDYGDGNDTIYENGDSSLDRIVFGVGITEDMISVERTSGIDLLINIDGGLGGSILIERQINYSNNFVIDEFEFADGTIITSFDEYLYNGLEAGETIRGVGLGGSGVDIIYGNGGNDIIYGYYGSQGTAENFLYGGNGNDRIYGEHGNDVIEGGAGTDFLQGYGGDDVYSWTVGDGNDTYNDDNGIDTLYLHSVDLSDIRFERSSNIHLKIHVNSEELTLQYQMYKDTYGNNPAHTRYQIDSLQLDDGTIIDLTEITTFTGTNSNENVYGSSSLSDVIYGLGGDDTLYGYAGDDNLHGGDGVDTLYGDVGSDTFVFEGAGAFSSVDTIQDFDLSENDKIDVSDLLAGYDPLTDAISDFIQITDNGADSVLSVDADGGADNFVQIATLKNVIGLSDEEALESNGNLIAA